MRAISRSKDRGFTLVELMIVVAIIGVLAALAIYGVRRYLSTAKSAEAKNTIGAINRGAVAAFERENVPSQIVANAGNSGAVTQALCNGATPVPATLAAVSGTKYQPSTVLTADYNAGTAATGWRCLKFSMTEPQYYQYQYVGGATPGAVLAGTRGTPPVTAGTATVWAAEAMGDLDNNGQNSFFQVGGNIRNGQPVTTTAVYENQADE